MPVLDIFQLGKRGSREGQGQLDILKKMIDISLTEDEFSHCNFSIRTFSKHSGVNMYQEGDMVLRTALFICV